MAGPDRQRGVVPVVPSTATTINQPVIITAGAAAVRASDRRIAMAARATFILALLSASLCPCTAYFLLHQQHPRAAAASGRWRRMATVATSRCASSSPSPALPGELPIHIRRARAKTICDHHEALRRGDGTSKAHALGEAGRAAYSEAMVDLSRAGWIQQNYSFIAETINSFCFGDGGVRCGALKNMRKHYRREYYNLHGHGMSQEQEKEVLENIWYQEQEPFSAPTQRRTRVLDVGACHNPMYHYAESMDIDLTAIDLHPADSTVLRGDFLEVPILEGRGDRLKKLNGHVQSLPADHYHAVVLSLVLSYIPGPQERAEMIRRARKVLRGPTQTHPFVPDGCLIVVEPLSTDPQGRSSSLSKLPIMKKWREDIETHGFQFHLYRRLARSHAMVFRTKVITEAPTARGLSIAFDEEAEYHRQVGMHGGTTR